MSPTDDDDIKVVKMKGPSLKKRWELKQSPKVVSGGAYEEEPIVMGVENPREKDVKGALFMVFAKLGDYASKELVHDIVNQVYENFPDKVKNELLAMDTESRQFKQVAAAFAEKYSPKAESSVEVQLKKALGKKYDGARADIKATGEFGELVDLQRQIVNLAWQSQSNPDFASFSKASKAYNEKIAALKKAYK